MDDTQNAQGNSVHGPHSQRNDTREGDDLGTAPQVHATPGAALMHAVRPDVLWGATVARLLIEDGAAPDAATLLASGYGAGDTLFQRVTRYLLTRVCGRAKGTCAGKSRDLALFVRFFIERHDHGDIAAWCEADTRHFLRQLSETKQNATINRKLAILKHFAKYVHEQPGSVFARHGQEALWEMKATHYAWLSETA